MQLLQTEGKKNETNENVRITTDLDKITEMFLKEETPKLFKQNSTDARTRLTKQNASPRSQLFGAKL